MRSVVVVLPASMWAMMPMLRVRSSGYSRLAISLLLSLGLALRLRHCVGGRARPNWAISTVFNAIGEVLVFARPSAGLAHRRAKVTGVCPRLGFQVFVAGALGVSRQLDPRPHMVRLQGQGLFDRCPH